nr:hypothetical protein [Tanacetum cinerariifolium]
MALNNAQTKTNSSAFKSMHEKHQLTGPNFNVWFRALKLVVRTEKLQDIFETALPPAPAAGANAQALADWAVHFYRHNKVACLMLGTMSPKLYQQFEHNSHLEMVTELQKMYEKPPDKVSISFILNSLSSEFQAFVQNYNMQSMEKTICEVHSLLIEFEKRIKRNKQPIVGASSTPQVVAIQGGRVQKCKPQGKAKGKGKGKVKDVLGLIHTDVCGPLRHVSKKGASYFITFTDDYSRYGYVYLIKHKHEVFETIKVFKSKVENQLRKTIKAIRSDRSGEYISQEFKDYLKSCEIVQQLTLPYTPQHNGVSERHNRTLLNMVRSMMSLATLPLSFWNYALESTARILNIGCEAHVKRHTPDKHQPRSVKCIFVGYPKKTIGYYFYYPPENKIVVERYAYFLEKDFILQKESGRIVESEDEDILPSENTSKHPIKTHKARDRLCLNVEIDPDRLCFNVEVEEHSLWDLNEPANYKAALSDTKFEKWLVAMNAKMQSTYDNKVWRLVVLPPNAKVVKSKWIYKKKTDMDGKNSGEAHWTAMKNILKFLRNTKDTFLVYGGDLEAELRVNCYCDAGFETDRDDTKSQTGYVFVLNGGAVVWKSSKTKYYCTSCHIS